MVFIDFDTDLIDYPKSVLRESGKFLGKSGNFPENQEFSRKFPGIFPKVFLELSEIIGIYGRKLEFKITGTVLELKFPTYSPSSFKVKLVLQF